MCTYIRWFARTLISPLFSLTLHPQPPLNFPSLLLPSPPSKAVSAFTPSPPIPPLPPVNLNAPSFCALFYLKNNGLISCTKWASQSGEACPLLSQVDRCMRARDLSAKTERRTRVSHPPKWLDIALRVQTNMPEKIMTSRHRQPTPPTRRSRPTHPLCCCSYSKTLL